MIRTDEGRSDVSKVISQLSELSLSILQQNWSRLFRRPAPSTLPRHLLIRMIAYQMQSNAFGDLAPETKRFLKSVGPNPDMKQLSATLAASSKQITSGTLLVREWKGQMHHVTVRNKEFVWKNKGFKSLSQVANAITGTRWNGPRFFGLRETSAHEPK